MLLAACSTPATTRSDGAPEAAAAAARPAPPEAMKQAVGARAEERWQALIRGDVAAAYEYLSPASRAVMPLDVYKGKHKVGMYRSAKVTSVDCDGDVCTVVMSVTYDYKRAKNIATPLTEKWIISGGRAWYVERT